MGSKCSLKVRKCLWRLSGVNLVFGRSISAPRFPLCRSPFSQHGAVRMPWDSPASKRDSHAPQHVQSSLHRRQGLGLRFYQRQRRGRREWRRALLWRP